MFDSFTRYEWHRPTTLRAKSLLDPYKEIIRTHLEAYSELSAARLVEEVKAAGYNGGMTQLFL